MSEDIGEGGYESPTPEDEIPGPDKAATEQQETDKTGDKEGERSEQSEEGDADEQSDGR